jgi:proteasome lid subunit RPN8/RPN11
VKLPKPLVEAMVAHAGETYPEECCGLLAGADGRPTHLYRIQNVH